MMLKTNYLKVNRIIALLLIVALLVTTVACSSDASSVATTEQEDQVITEDIITEDIITEDVVSEFITSEIYLEEFVIVEDKITECLLQEEKINEVVLCKTVYVPENNIDDFAEHSQTAQIFGQNFDIKPVLAKIAIGTGIIVTLAIVKKAGIEKPIASIVAAAADDSMKFAKSGAVVGTVFGAFTGAKEEIGGFDRTSALIGFALATVGLIMTGISAWTAIPSGGTSGFGVAEGVHLALAGIRVILAGIGTVVTAKDAVKAFTSTDVSEIDWENVDWNAVGVAAAEKAIKNGADGYMWGAIYGAIDGAAEGYYNKYCTPYTKYKNRLKKVPKDGSKGHWSGKRGESDFVLNEPIELPDGTVITKIHYQNAVPDFSPYAIAEVKIPCMTNERYIAGGNFDQADEALAKFWTEMKYNNKDKWTADDIKLFRESYPCKLTWHEMSNMESMQLVPLDVNQTFTHCGGVAEYNAMRGEDLKNEFD